MTDLEKQQIFELIKQAKEGKQSAFTRLYNRFSKIIYNTIYYIVNNKDVASIDYIRHTKKEKANYWIDDDANSLQLSNQASYSPEEDYIFSEKSDALDNALSRLRWKYRNIIELRSIQNLSYKQISEHLGLTESQVKSRLNKAREKLKELLTD